MMSDSRKLAIVGRSPEHSAQNPLLSFEPTTLGFKRVNFANSLNSLAAIRCL